MVSSSSARLRSGEVADDGHFVAVRGGGEAGCGVCAVQDDPSMWRALHPNVERLAWIRSGPRAQEDDLAAVAGAVARISDADLRRGAVRTDMAVQTVPQHVVGVPLGGF